MSGAGAHSQALFARAQAVLPGGVSSPVRAFRAVGGTPRVIARANGTEVEDVDGRRYLDFVCSWGPLILGHAHPAVVEAVSAAASRGTSYGAPCPGEIELAEKVCGMVPALEAVRFVSSGTEATMSAIRLARGFTGREFIVKFAGCYHGHADHLLVAAGSGLVTFGTPSSAGVPQAFAERTLVLELDDEAALEALFAERGHEIAAVIVEPVPANNGLLLQRPEFLSRLRAVTEAAGALLIFDEVITRLSRRARRRSRAPRHRARPRDVRQGDRRRAAGRRLRGAARADPTSWRRTRLRCIRPARCPGNPLAMAAGPCDAAGRHGTRAQRAGRDWKSSGVSSRTPRRRRCSAMRALPGPDWSASAPSSGSSLQDGDPPRAARAPSPTAPRERYRPGCSTRCWTGAWHDRAVGLRGRLPLARTQSGRRSSSSPGGSPGRGLRNRRRCGASPCAARIELHSHRCRSASFVTMFAIAALHRSPGGCIDQSQV